jgi:hypothetical protein
MKGAGLAVRAQRVVAEIIESTALPKELMIVTGAPVKAARKLRPDPVG